MFAVLQLTCFALLLFVLVHPTNAFVSRSSADVYEATGSELEAQHAKMLGYTDPPPQYSCNDIKDGSFPASGDCANRWNAWDAGRQYLTGNGENVTLEKTGLVDKVTDYWENEILAKIEKYVCNGGKAPKSFSVTRPLWPLCHYWIGSFTITLVGIEDLGGNNYKLTLVLRVTFKPPFFPIGITCELPGGTSFDVVHKWTIVISCPNATAVSDPHLVNLGGESFDILRTGQMPFLLGPERNP